MNRMWWPFFCGLLLIACCVGGVALYNPPEIREAASVQEFVEAGTELTVGGLLASRITAIKNGICVQNGPMLFLGIAMPGLFFIGAVIAIDALQRRIRNRQGTNLSLLIAPALLFAFGCAFSTAGTITMVVANPKINITNTSGGIQLALNIWGTTQQTVQLDKSHSPRLLLHWAKGCEIYLIWDEGKIKKGIKFPSRYNIDAAEIFAGKIVDVVEMPVVHTETSVCDGNRKIRIDEETKSGGEAGN